MQASILLLSQLGNIAFEQVYNYADKLKVFKQARQTADRLGKPLLNYGCKTAEPFASQSDLNVDIVPRNVPNFMLILPDGGVHLPFQDKEFGAVFLSHVLEHTENPPLLLQELNRISDYVFIVYSQWWAIAQYIHPGHRWITINGKFYRNNPSMWGALLVGFDLLLLSI